MDSYAWYILSSGLCLGLLLLFYRLALARLTHFRWNRFYLLASMLACIILPGAVSSVNWPTPLELPLLESVLLPVQGLEAPMPAGLEETAMAAHDPAPVLTLSKPVWRAGTAWPWIKKILWIVYGLGLGLALWRLASGVFQVMRLYWSSPREKHGSFTLVQPPELKASFSFFRLLFLSHEDKEPEQKKVVLAHEVAHIRELHSLDILLAEIMASLAWFFPWNRYLKRSLSSTHEYLADQAAAKGPGRIAYSKILLSKGVSLAQLPVHYFAQSKTHKRIQMLNQNPSSGFSRWSYLTILPVLILAVSLMACMPGPKEADSFDLEAMGNFSFADENTPENVRFREGLEQMVAKLKSKPGYCQKLVLRHARFRPVILPMLKEEGLPSDFIYLMMAESNLDVDAVSSMGACGVWQFMPETAKSYGMVVDQKRDDRLNLQLATKAAAAYLQKYKAEFGSWTSAALAFNRGAKPLREKGLGKDLNRCYELDHDRGYLYRILAIKQLISRPTAWGIQAGPAFDLPFSANTKVEISSGFGMRNSPFDDKMKNHDGVDFRAKAGTEVRAVSDGIVKTALLSEKGRGNQVEMAHGEILTTHYNHLQDVFVKVGQQVKKGGLIGTVGSSGRSTGPHLHLEIREGNVPVNPELYLSL